MHSSFFEIGPIKNFILLGYTPYVLDFEDYCNSNGINFYFITTHSQVSNLNKKPKTLLLEEFDISQIKIFKYMDFKDKQSLALSIGAR